MGYYWLIKIGAGREEADKSITPPSMPGGDGSTLSQGEELTQHAPLQRSGTGSELGDRVMHGALKINVIVKMNGKHMKLSMLK